MKSKEKILQDILEQDFAKRKFLPGEYEAMPLKEHILKAIELYHSQFTKSSELPSLSSSKAEVLSFEKFVRKYYPDANLGICINCNADKGLHKHGTMQCPRNGMEETREGVRQVWTVSTYSDIGAEVRQEYKGYLLGCHTNIVELTDEEIEQTFPMDDGKITNAFNQQQLAFQHGAQWARDYINNKTK